MYSKVSNRQKPLHVLQCTWITPSLIFFRYVMATFDDKCFHAFDVDLDGCCASKHHHEDVADSFRVLAIFR